MAEAKKNIDEQITHEHMMRRILSLAVISVGAIIALLWGLAIRNRFVALSWDGSTEQRLVDSARSQWEAAQIAAGAKTQSLEEVKREVKEKLTAILSAGLATSSASTTEISVSTSAILSPQ